MYIARSARLLLVAALAAVFAEDLRAQVLHNGCDADQILDQADPDHLDHMGQSISIGGDFNGDGFKDIAMGGYTRSSGGTTQDTRAFVFLGTGNSAPFNGSNPAFRHRLTINGPDTFDLFGFSVAFIGDMNDDGCDELVVGSPRFDGPGLTDSGRVSIIFGDEDLDPAVTTYDPQTDDVEVENVQDLTFNGPEDNEWFGAAVATAQDGSGNYLKDLLIGAPGGGPVNSTSIKGRVYQVESPSIDSAETIATANPGIAVATSSVSGTPGISGSLQSGYVLTAHRLLQGGDEGDQFGSAVAFVGNLDGNAGQEFLVGAPMYQGELPNFVTIGAGYARLYKLSSATPLIQIDGTQEGSESLARGGEAFGFSVAGGVDVDDDTVPDLLIGAPLFNVDEVIPGEGKVHAGRVRAFSGDAAASGSPSAILDDGAPNHTVMVGEGGSHQFGYSVAGVPDIDGDSIDDVLVGAWQADIDSDSFCTVTNPLPRTGLGGSATIFSPGSTPTAGARIAIFYGEAFRDHMGRAVAAGELLDTAGAPEIVLSGVAWTPPDAEEGVDPTEVGRAYVWDGESVIPE